MIRALGALIDVSSVELSAPYIGVLSSGIDRTPLAHLTSRHFLQTVCLDGEAMKQKTRVFIPILVVAFSCVAVAQAERLREATTRSEQGLALLRSTQGSLRSSGVAAIADVSVEGTITLADGSTGTFIAKARGSDYSFETNRGGERSAYRVLKGVGSAKHGDKMKHLQPHNTIGLKLDLIPHLGDWNSFESTAAQVSDPTNVELGGRPGYEVTVVAPQTTAGARYKTDRNKIRVVIDAESGELLAIKFRATQGPYQTDQVDLEQRFSGYREVGGLVVPTKVSKYRDGKLIAELTVNSVRVNVGLTDADFSN